MGIGALSRLTDCNIETIRYYEKQGLLPKPPRSAGGHRVYSATHLKRLTFVKRSRNLGFSMAEIRELLSLVDEHEYSCEHVKQLTLAHAKDIRKKISDLKRLENALNKMASDCSGDSVPHCPIVDALYEPLMD